MNVRPRGIEPALSASVCVLDRRRKHHGVPTARQQAGREASEFCERPPFLAHCRPPKLHSTERRTLRARNSKPRTRTRTPKTSVAVEDKTATTIRGNAYDGRLGWRTSRLLTVLVDRTLRTFKNRSGQTDAALMPIRKCCRNGCLVPLVMTFVASQATEPSSCSPVCNE